MLPDRKTEEAVMDLGWLCSNVSVVALQLAGGIEGYGDRKRTPMMLPVIGMVIYSQTGE